MEIRTNPSPAGPSPSLPRRTTALPTRLLPRFQSVRSIYSGCSPSAAAHNLYRQKSPAPCASPTTEKSAQIPGKCGCESTCEEVPRGLRFSVLRIPPPLSGPATELPGEAAFPTYQSKPVRASAPTARSITFALEVPMSIPINKFITYLRKLLIFLPNRNGRSLFHSLR